MGILGAFDPRAREFFQAPEFLGYWDNRFQMTEKRRRGQSIEGRWDSREKSGFLTEGEGF
jgi:hypothetical protein